MSRARGQLKVRRRLSGVAFLTVLVLLAWLSVALYQKKFSTVAIVTLYTDSAGSEMHPGAEVMLRGVQVGEVRRISADGSGARLELAIQPGDLRWLPANVTAEMLPMTLFGERYVDLITPARPAAVTLANGSVIRQDHSADALELEQVLNNLFTLLVAVQPDKLSLTLTAIAHGLAGRGKELGQTLVTLNAYLRTMNPRLPQLDTDIKLLAGLARTYTRATPAIVAALNDFSVTGETIARQRADFGALLTNITTASDDLRAFLDANAPNMIGLSADSLPTLAILARYAPEFPCMLRDLANFVPKANKMLGMGTGQPGLHVQLVVVQSPGRYLPGKDTPRYGDDLGPHCYPVPFPGIHLDDGTSRPPASRPPASPPSASPPSGGHGAAKTTAAAVSLNDELVRELTALWLGRSPATLPAWGYLLTGPLFLGTEVIIR